MSETFFIIIGINLDFFRSQFIFSLVVCGLCVFFAENRFIDHDEALFNVLTCFKLNIWVFTGREKSILFTFSR
jgi:hypothetical protein